MLGCTDIALSRKKRKSQRRPSAPAGSGCWGTPCWRARRRRPPPRDRRFARRWAACVFWPLSTADAHRRILPHAAIDDSDTHRTNGAGQLAATDDSAPLRAAAACVITKRSNAAATVKRRGRRRRGGVRLSILVGLGHGRHQASQRGREVEGASEQARVCVCERERDSSSLAVCLNSTGQTSKPRSCLRGREGGRERVCV